MSYPGAILDDIILVRYDDPLGEGAVQVCQNVFFRSHLSK